METITAITVVFIYFIANFIMGYLIALGLIVITEQGINIAGKARAKFRRWRAKRQGWLDQDFDGDFGVVAEQGFLALA